MAMQSDAGAQGTGSTTSSGEIAGEFGFGAVSDWIAIEPGSHQISFAPGGTSGETIAVNGAHILTPNIPAMNGTIHMIGLPPAQG